MASILSSGKVRHLSFRVDAPTLALIDERAREHKLSRTKYVLACTTGTLQADDTAERLDDLQARTERLEAALFSTQ